jgi:Cdc6-like AAA superfamily ATPase
MEKKRRVESDATMNPMEPVTTLLRNQEQAVQYICTVGQICERMTGMIEAISAQVAQVDERLRKMEERQEEITRLQHENGDLRAQLTFCEDELQKKCAKSIYSSTQCHDFT